MRGTKERLLGAVARYAKGKKGRLVGLEFKRFARVSDRTLQVHFEGGFAGLVKAAGLRGKVRRVNIPDEDLLKVYHGLVERLGRHPKWHEVMREGPHMPAVYFRRFGRTRQVRERYEAWVGFQELRSCALLGDEVEGDLGGRTGGAAARLPPAMNRQAFGLKRKARRHVGTEARRERDEEGSRAKDEWERALR